MLLLYVLASMVIGGLIGGVTNALAIKMLFHPRTPWTIGNWRIPFTPGLIPKRREEVALQLGRIVSEHLLTKEGIEETISSSENRTRLEKWLHATWDELENRPAPIREWCVNQFGEEVVTGFANKWDLQVTQWTEELFHQWMTSENFQGKTVKSILPLEGEEYENVKGYVIQKSTNVLLKEVEGFILSSKGEEWIRSLIKQMSGGGSGFLSSLAGVFMQGSGVVTMVRDPMIRYVRSEETKQFLNGRIEEIWEKWMGLQGSAVLQRIPRERLQKWAARLSTRLLSVNVLLDLPIGSLLSRFRDRKEEWISRVSGWLLRWSINQIHHVLEAVNIRQTVRNQVSRFPLERLEEVILEVSGREFRMITWLGVLLGMLIGGLQAAILLLFF